MGTNHSVGSRFLKVPSYCLRKKHYELFSNGPSRELHGSTHPPPLVKYLTVAFSTGYFAYEIVITNFEELTILHAEPGSAETFFPPCTLRGLVHVKYFRTEAPSSDIPHLAEGA